jgi:ribosomal protein S18 acetylase RimI-like enzyme
MEIRPALTAEDVTVVAALLDAFNREFDAPTPGPGIIATRLARLLAADSTFALLAGQPAVGVALVTLRPNVWYEGSVAMLDELYVLPERRNAGIGSRLLRSAEAAITERGGEVLEINVDGEDTDARRFYERHGYVHHDEWASDPSLMYFRELGQPGL